MQTHVIEGKVRTKVAIDADEALTDGHANDWVAVVVDGEWRLVDVMFAARSQSTDPGDWELIDDNGQVWML